MIKSSIQDTVLRQDFFEIILSFQVEYIFARVLGFFSPSNTENVLQASLFEAFFPC